MTNRSAVVMARDCFNLYCIFSTAVYFLVLSLAKTLLGSCHVFVDEMNSLTLENCIR